MAQNNTLHDALQRQGLRLTSRRRLVLEILQESSEHLDAEMVYTRARRKDPHISLATVYRTLARLKSLGVIEEHQFGESHGHFEAVPAKPHFHFKCQRCGRVSEFSAPQVEELVRNLCRETGNTVEQVSLDLSGVCAACQAPTNRE